MHWHTTSWASDPRFKSRRQEASSTSASEAPQETYSPGSSCEMEATFMTNGPLRSLKLPRVKSQRKSRRPFQRCNRRPVCAKTCTSPKNSTDSKFINILHAEIKIQQVNQHQNRRTHMFRNSTRSEAIKPGKTRDIKWYRSANKKVLRGKTCHCSMSQVTCRPVYSRSRTKSWFVSSSWPRRWGHKRGLRPLFISLSSVGKRHKLAMKSSFARWTTHAKSHPKSKSNHSLRQGRWLLKTLPQCLEQRAVLDKNSRST